ncbi:alkyl hydroperoxide reductase/Thiol spific antioxidant family protein [Candidatus Nitrosocosmicus arcticus]|uniref:thioredoxin-dependent peroxiredoxin n=2 Tax=Candidatus Nitrosocosmicus arcticus TaxID=2035267 RepID=A0A557SVT1_9ARCH|nr:alkyl hydroperoxide reductase/Thiol spific antioxidant family protein [Candidatus Nitrosocosmicus arcticus]
MTNQEDYNVMKVKEGDKPVDFEYQNPKGEKFKLSKLLNQRKIVIYFYPKDFTPGCTIEAEEFTRDYALFEQHGIEVIGISPDSDDSHTKFRRKMNIPYMLASDSTNEISKGYGVYVLKKFMDKEYYGVSRSTFLIDRGGKIAKIYSSVKPRGHSTEVLEFFKE